MGNTGPPDFQLEAGKFYKNRAGNIVGPLLVNSDVNANDYPFCTRTLPEFTSWTKRGQYFRYFIPHQQDLVEEVPDPNPYIPGTMHWQPPTVRYGSTPPYELERLVHIANQGTYAARQLQNQYAGRYEVRSTWANGNAACAWDLPHSTTPVREHRIKPEKPKFQPLTIQLVNAHEITVSLSDNGDKLIAGCITINTRDAYPALRAFTRDNVYKCGLVSGLSLYACAMGIKVYKEGQTGLVAILSWADADSLLAALDKYFEKDGK